MLRIKFIHKQDKYARIKEWHTNLRITTPSQRKPSGYRGIHTVYRSQTRNPKCILNNWEM
jgi:hypothetical protein